MYSAWPSEHDVNIQEGVIVYVAAYYWVQHPGPGGPARHPREHTEERSELSNHLAVHYPSFTPFNALN